MRTPQGARIVLGPARECQPPAAPGRPAGVTSQIPKGLEDGTIGRQADLAGGRLVMRGGSLLRPPLRSLGARATDQDTADHDAAGQDKAEESGVNGGVGSQLENLSVGCNRTGSRTGESIHGAHGGSTDADCWKYEQQK